MENKKELDSFLESSSRRPGVPAERVPGENCTRDLRYLISDPLLIPEGQLIRPSYAGSLLGFDLGGKQKAIDIKMK